MNIIERLKTNMTTFDFMAPELKEAANKIGKAGNFEYYNRTPPNWFLLTVPAEFDGDRLYRLRQDYQCQHPEKTPMSQSGLVLRCSWCGCEIPAEKNAGWVEFEVYDFNGYWSFMSDKEIRHRIDAAPGMVGFGGIKYESPCECYGGGTTDWSYNPPDPCEHHGPWKPVSVRFWKEK